MIRWLMSAIAIPWLQKRLHRQAISRQLEEQNRQLQAGYEAQLSYKDSTAMALLNGYNNLRSSFDTVSKNYNHLYTDYTKSGRKVNFQKWEIRGLAAIALVSG
jgi:hypothetical protein